MICICCGKEKDSTHVCDHDNCHVIVTAKKYVVKLEADVEAVNKRLSDVWKQLDANNTTLRCVIGFLPEKHRPHVQKLISRNKEVL